MKTLHCLTDGFRSATSSVSFLVAFPLLFLGTAWVFAQPCAAQSGTWTATGSLTTARYNHTATSLTTGKVLVAGGWDFDSGGFLASAELLGDVNGDRVVDGTDLSIVRHYRGQHTDGTNYRSDASNDGFINASDVHLVNQQQGASLP